MTTEKNWSEEWLEAQQKMVATWTEMAKNLESGTTGPQSNFWAESVDLWRKSYGSNATPDAQKIFDKCMEMSKEYFTMAEQMGKAAYSDSNPLEVINNWLNQVIAGLQQQAAQWPSMSNQYSSEFMNQWSSPASSWQKMASVMLPIQQSLGQMSGSGGSAFNMGDVIDPLGKLLTAPGLGYFRESQEKQQKGIQLALEYQQANAKYNQLFISTSVESIQGFQQQLQNQYTNSEGQALPSSLRELYDQWIFVSEEHYAELAMSDEYQALYGDMVNRLMSLKKHYAEMTDELMKSMNLPARSEIDTMQMRLQQLRRDNFSLRAELDEIKSMLSKSSKPAVTKTASTKTPVKKKAAKTSKPKSKAGA